MFLKFITHSTDPSRKPSSLLGKAAKILAALVIVSLVLFIAAVLFIYIAIGTVFVFGYFWWKTRSLRKKISAAPPQSSHDGLVIEGEVIHQPK